MSRVDGFRYLPRGFRPLYEAYRAWQPAEPSPIVSHLFPRRGP